MPPALEHEPFGAVTMPFPTTVRVKTCFCLPPVPVPPLEVAVKLAPTVFALVTEQVVVVLEQDPVQPVKVLPPDDVAVSVTVELLVKLAEQPKPPELVQLIAAGLLVTVPLPETTTVSGWVVVVVVVNVAETD